MQYSTTIQNKHILGVDAETGVKHLKEGVKLCKRIPDTTPLGPIVSKTVEYIPEPIKRWHYSMVSGKQH